MVSVGWRGCGPLSFAMDLGSLSVFINNTCLAVQPVSMGSSLKPNCSVGVPPVDASSRLWSLFSSFIASN